MTRCLLNFVAHGGVRAVACSLSLPIHRGVAFYPLASPPLLGMQTLPSFLASCRPWKTFGRLTLFCIFISISIRTWSSENNLRSQDALFSEIKGAAPSTTYKSGFCEKILMRSCLGGEFCNTLKKCKYVGWHGEVSVNNKEQVSWTPASRPREWMALWRCHKNFYCPSKPI